MADSQEAIGYRFCSSFCFLGEGMQYFGENGVRFVELGIRNEE